MQKMLYYTLYPENKKIPGEKFNYFSIFLGWLDLFTNSS
jgi:hypothetical protein